MTGKARPAFVFTVACHLLLFPSPITVTLSLVTGRRYARNPFIHRQLQKYYKELRAFLVSS